MVAIRKEVDQTVPLATFQKVQSLLQHERNRRIEMEQENIRLRKIVYNTKFSINERAIALEVAEQMKEAKHVDKQGRKLFSQKDAADRLGLSRGTISTAVDILAESGFIKDKETRKLRDKEGKIIKGKDGRPITTIHLDIEQDLYEDFSKAERSAPRKIKEERKKPTCQKCGSEDVTIKTEKTLICRNPNCKHETQYEDPTFEHFSAEAPSIVHKICTEENLNSAQILYTGKEDSNGAQNLCTIEVRDESNSAPPLVPAPADHVGILENWIQKRRGTPRVIQATGQLEAARKYVSKPETYEPDIEAFIAGKIGHIYGSRLNNLETGKTSLLCFECDTPEHSEIAMNSMSTLARAGIGAIYWPRQRDRAHFEPYFDNEVDSQVAYQLLLEICPDLEAIPEVFPCAGIENRTNHPLSWPMWQRIGGQVYPCKALAILPAPHDGAMREVDPTNLEALAQLVTDAVTPSAMVEEFAVILEERSKLRAREQEIEGIGGGAIGITPKPITQVQGDDLIPQVLANFDDQHSWDDIAVPCGGLVDGRFCAIWRASRSRSVVIDPRNEKYAHDYGQVGSYRSHFDKHQAWCYIHGKDRTADLAERCAQLRRAEIKIVMPVDPATELFPVKQTEQKLQGPMYAICPVCSTPKTVKRADGVYTCGTSHL